LLILIIFAAYSSFSTSVLNRHSQMLGDEGDGQPLTPPWQQN